ncbi:iron complex transport system permease protein [Pseudoxanthomonas sp. GM95]|nr:iron complex transport system permease protein [Pseudoxanthomonas sp. GM95]
MQGGSAHRSRQRIALLAGLVLLAVLALVSCCVGTRTLPLSVTWQAVQAFDPGNSDHLLVRLLRIPRTLIAIVVGVALGAAGAVMQALTRNPLADPGLLGINAGAATAITVAVVAFGITDVTGYLWCGLIGAALAGAGVYLLGGVDPVRLVLAGVALTVVLQALTQVILLNSDEAVYDQFRHWSVGSLQGRGMAVFWPVAVATLLGSALALSLARPLDAVVLGEDLGHALGAHPLRVWSLAMLAVVVLAGAATAAAGPLAFVGLAAPHVARRIVGPAHRVLMPASMLIAALLLLAADVLGRVIAWPSEIGVGIMAALIGGPCFVALARQRRIAHL